MKTGFFHASLYFAFHFNVSVTAGCYSSLYNNYMCGEFKVPCSSLSVGETAYSGYISPFIK